MPVSKAYTAVQGGLRGGSRESSGRNEKNCRGRLRLPRERSRGREQKMSLEIWRVKAIQMRFLDENEKHIIGNWRKDNLCYKVAKHLANLCSCSRVLYEAGLVISETGHWAEETGKQNDEGAAWLLLTFYSKMLEDRHDCKMDLFIKRKLLENSQSNHVGKYEVAYLRQNTKGTAKVLRRLLQTSQS